ncbi:MAG: TrmH family RNA methyltransferase [Candidatus Promineifilaceae bacterium]|jgi:TrmH family RNA methyltransferase
MPVAEPITSLQNPRVKNVVRLSNRRHRDRQQQTVVEGVREATLALRSGIVPDEVFICPEFSGSVERQELDQQLYELAAGGRTRLFQVPPAVFDKMAYRAGSGGVLLVIPYLKRTLQDIAPGGNPLVAVVDGAEKPGNLGAILRTADAAGLDALLLTADEPGGTDIHNPNVIRASLGAFFSIPVVTVTMEQALRWLQENGITTVATTPDAQQVYTAVNLAGPTAIIMGSEAAGLGRQWLDAADIQARIPMTGWVDSLNLSVSTALLLYEALRQRNTMSTGSA